MSKSNRSAREMLEKIYGKHCFIHEGIRKLKPPTPNKRNLANCYKVGGEDE